MKISLDEKQLEVLTESLKRVADSFRELTISIEKLSEQVKSVKPQGG